MLTPTLASLSLSSRVTCDVAIGPHGTLKPVSRLRLDIIHKTELQLISQILFSGTQFGKGKKKNKKAVKPYSESNPVELNSGMAVSEEESSSGSSKSRRSTSSASAANGAYYLAKCALRGSVVLQVVHGHIRSPSSNDVVFGKVIIPPSPISPLSFFTVYTTATSCTIFFHSVSVGFELGSSSCHIVNCKYN